ncbi:MAG: hypothetical protein ACKVS6_15715 [Planctomycetota bacterium]
MNDRENDRDPAIRNAPSRPQNAHADSPVRANTKNRRRRKRKTKARQTENTAAPPSQHIDSNEFAPRGIAHAVREAMEGLRWSALALARSRGLEQKLAGIELKLQIKRGVSADLLALSFLKELSSRLDEAQTEEEFVVPNRAYCFRCESFLCEHSVQPQPLSVLAHYEPTGRPRWVDFASLLYDRRDPRAEALANREAGVVAIVLDADEITGNRIEAFGGANPQIEVLSQLIAGPFPIVYEGGEDEGALTLQWLRVRNGSQHDNNNNNHHNGASRQRLIFHEVGDSRLLDVAGSIADPGLARILSSTRAAARTLPWQNIKKREPRTADPFVTFAASRAHELARDLQHYFSARSRRTQHAQERSEAGVRPTAHAFPEALSAADDAIRLDIKTKTYVLLGKNSRVHFFNSEGRHVTSVRFAGDAIRARVDTGRWRRATRDEIVTFRARVDKITNTKRPGER